MKVNFKRDFYTADRRYRVANNPNSVPEALRHKLPSDAEIVKEPKPKSKSKGKGKGKSAKPAEPSATTGAPPDGAED
jgi:hypothetical protein